MVLRKEVISDLNKQQISGGQTSGCSDGCSVFQTVLFCTQADCSADCNDGITWLCSFIEQLCLAGE